MRVRRSSASPYAGWERVIGAGGKTVLASFHRPAAFGLAGVRRVAAVMRSRVTVAPRSAGGRGEGDTVITGRQGRRCSVKLAVATMHTNHTQTQLIRIHTFKHKYWE